MITPDPAALDRLARREPMYWANPNRLPLAGLLAVLPFSLADVTAAAARFARLAPLLARIFPELAPAGGLVESPLVPAPRLARELGRTLGREVPGDILLKRDDALPVAGSVKARGGFYAVLRQAERLAVAAGLHDPDQGDPLVLASPQARELFAGFTLAVGSTGNLGLSIGLAGRALGFTVMVHMSAEAKEWKKARLRAAGATVVEHAGDYGAALAAARAATHGRADAHFIDDESDPDLFLGYAAAGPHLARQLADLGLAGRPVWLFLPCGVGGAPGGLALAARLVLGDTAHPVLVEPATAPCCTLGLVSGRLSDIALSDIGLSVATEADGLAVGRCSRLAAPLLSVLADGCATVAEDELFPALGRLHETEELLVEPSAAAALPGLERLLQSPAGSDLTTADRQPPVFVLWLTGGSLLPEAIRADFRAKARQALAPGK